MTRSGVMPNFAARTVRSPASRAGPGRARRCRWRTGSPPRPPGRSSWSGGSRRSGRQLISTATPCSRQAPNTASASNADSGRLRPPAEHPAGAVAEHVHVRVADRGHHPLGHRLGGHPQLGVHAGHDHVEPGEQVLPLVQRAVLQDVDLDPGQDPERRQLGVQLADQRRAAPPAARPTGRWPRSAGASDRSARSTRGPAPGPPRPSPRGGLPPSDQSECVWQSPRSAARSSSAAAGRWPLREQPGQVVRLLRRPRPR